MPIKIFVGSSTIAKTQAKLFIAGCANPNVEYLPWWDQFTAGKNLLEELDRLRQKVSAAILLITPEADAKNFRGTKSVLPNQNVLFEFGYFYAALGKENVALAKYGAADLPSDLGGYIHLFGSRRFQRNAGVPVGVRTKAEFNRWLDALITARG